MNLNLINKLNRHIFNLNKELCNITTKNVNRQYFIFKNKYRFIFNRNFFLLTQTLKYKYHIKAVF
jgi:hypothetical protein